MQKTGQKATNKVGLSESNINRKKRLVFKKELHSNLKEVRVNYKGVKVSAYEKDGVVGRYSVKDLTFYPIEDYGVYRNGEHWYLRSKTLLQSNKETTRYRNLSPEQHLISSIKNRAKRTGLDFDINKLTLPKKCPILGLELDYTYGSGRHDNKATVDRIDNSKGYTIENVVVCSWRANRLKNDASLEELEKIYKFVKRHTQRN